MPWTETILATPGSQTVAANEDCGGDNVTALADHASKPKSQLFVFMIVFQPLNVTGTQCTAPLSSSPQISVKTVLALI